MDLSIVLLGFPIAFLLGWLASRIDFKQLRLENEQSPKAYFKGLNFLLNEQQDQAIDAFIEAVQRDPDTSELHFALGNLFRRRGEYDRAVRVHEHLISRADLQEEDRHRAQFALATDYLSAGILDRAETVLLTLSGTHYGTQSRLALLSLYERTRDWEHAAQVAHQLSAKGEGQFDSRLAHYRCEQAIAIQATDGDFAKRLLLEAHQILPSADRPLVELARLLVSSDPAQSFDYMHTLIHDQRPTAPLVAVLYAQTAAVLHREDIAWASLTACYQKTRSLDVLEGMATLVTIAPHMSWAGAHDAQDLFMQHLEKETSLIAVQRWLQMQGQKSLTLAPGIEQAVAKATKSLHRYRCASCGFETQQHYWNCPGCLAWDSYPPKRIEEL